MNVSIKMSAVITSKMMKNNQRNEKGIFCDFVRECKWLVFGKMHGSTGENASKDVCNACHLII